MASNHDRPGYEPGALPIELKNHFPQRRILAETSMSVEHRVYPDSFAVFTHN